MALRFTAVLALVLVSPGAIAESPQDRWNLTALYPTPAAWSADVDRAKAQLKDVAACKGRLGTATRFAQCMKLTDDLSRRYGRLAVYASETHNQDTGEGAGIELDQKTQVLGRRSARRPRSSPPRSLRSAANASTAISRPTSRSRSSVIRSTTFCAPRRTRSTPPARGWSRSSA